MRSLILQEGSRSFSLRPKEGAGKGTGRPVLAPFGVGRKGPKIRSGISGSQKRNPPAQRAWRVIGAEFRWSLCVANQVVGPLMRIALLFRFCLLALVTVVKDVHPNGRQKNGPNPEQGKPVDVGGLFHVGSLRRYSGVDAAVLRMGQLSFISLSLSPLLMSGIVGGDAPCSMSAAIDTTDNKT